MRTTGFLPFFALVLLVVLSLQHRHVEAADDSYSRTIEWLKSVLPEGIENAPFGNHRIRYEGGREYDGQEGFLIKDGSASFVFYSIQGQLWTLLKRPKGPEGANEIDFVPGDVGDWLDRYVAVEPVRNGFSIEGLAVRTAALALYVNHCLGGEHRTATLRKRLASKLDEARYGSHVETGSLDRLRLLMGRLAADELVEAFNDTSLSRRDLLARYERHGKLYPTDSGLHHDDMIALLKAMIAEDEAHPAIDLNDLPQEAQIAELIYRLRDQTGTQYSIPGRCNILGGLGLPRNGQERNTPANQLVRIGLPAVPQLIEAMTDERLSRAVGHKGKFDHVGRALTVGECAEEILRHLSGEPLIGLRPADRGRSPQELARQWWADIQKKGERNSLVDRVVSGDQRSPVHARKLVKQYPESALDAIRRGIEAASPGFPQTRLVETLRDLQRPEVDAYLVEIAGRDELSELRFSAIDLLRSRTPKVASAITMSLLHETVLLSFQETRPSRPRDGGLSRLMRVAARLHDPATLDRFRSLWDRLPVQVKYAWKDAVDDTIRVLNRDSKLLESWKPAVEEFFVFLLTDRSVVVGLRGSWGLTRFNEPRLCDMVGLSLAQWWDRYPFDYGKSKKDRDLSIARCRNVWLAQQGVPLEPEPELASVTPIELVEFEKLLNSILAATSDAALDEAVARLADRGLQALQRLDYYLSGAPEIPAVRLDRLIRLRHELSWKVTNVTVADTMQKDWKRSVDWADPAKWSSLEDAVYELVDSFLREGPRMLATLEIRVERPGDFSGATIHLATSSGDGSESWGRMRIQGSTRNSAEGFRPDPVDDRAKESIRATFAVPIRDEARVHITITRRPRH